MADVKWIKITTDVFDDEKILLIESLPEADSIIVIWFKLLCLAGKQNNSGVFLMGDKIAYTDKMLATIFRRKESTVQLALQTFEQFGMIELIDGVITIPNWGKHQSLDQLEHKKQYMKNYMREYRNKQKALTQNDKLCENGLPMNEWIEVLNFFDHECAYCGCKEGLEQEHIIPVDKGGRYVIGNIVPSCRKCNASKGAKEMQEWYSKSDVFSQERLEKIMMYSCKTNINHLHKANVRQADKEEDKNKNRLEEDKNIIDESDDSSPAPAKKPVKNKHGEYGNVKLTDSEFEKLASDYGEALRDKAISFLDEYIEEKGYKSKSHNLAIRRWVIDAVKEKEQKESKGRKEIVPDWLKKQKFNDFKQSTTDSQMDDMERKLRQEVNDKDFQERAEKLKAELQEKYGRKV